MVWSIEIVLCSFEDALCTIHDWLIDHLPVELCCAALEPDNLASPLDLFWRQHKSARNMRTLTRVDAHFARESEITGARRLGQNDGGVVDGYARRVDRPDKPRRSRRDHNLGARKIKDRWVGRVEVSAKVDRTECEPGDAAISLTLTSPRAVSINGMTGTPCIALMM